MEKYLKYEEYNNVQYIVYTDDNGEPVARLDTLSELIKHLNITDIHTIVSLGSMGDCGIYELDNMTIHKIVL